MRLERWNNRQVVVEAEPPIQLMRKFSNPGQEAILKPKVQRHVKRRRVHLLSLEMKNILQYLEGVTRKYENLTPLQFLFVQLPA